MTDAVLLRVLEATVTLAAGVGMLGCLWFVADTFLDARASRKLGINGSNQDTAIVLIALVLAHGVTLSAFASLGGTALLGIRLPPLVALGIYAPAIVAPSLTVLGCQVYRRRRLRPKD